MARRKVDVASIMYFHITIGIKIENIDHFNFHLKKKRKENIDIQINWPSKKHRET